MKYEKKLAEINNAGLTIYKVELHEADVRCVWLYTTEQHARNHFESLKYGYCKAKNADAMISLYKMVADIDGTINDDKRLDAVLTHTNQ